MSMASEGSSTWSQISRKVMICNPFLVLSPLFLLQGIHEAVRNPNLFTTDLSNTLFVFTALLVYLTLLGVISTRLGERMIFADATLLLCIQMVLFIAPFILIAHGVFLESGIALSLGISGWLAGMGQLLHLKRRLPRTFVSSRLLTGAGVILAVAVALPMVFRQGLENEGNDNEVWGRLAPYAWNVLLPMLVLWLMAIPGSSEGKPVWRRAWFAPAVHLTWVIGLAMQLWTLAYVDDRHLRGHEPVLSIWLLSWILIRRANLLPDRCATLIRKSVPTFSVVVLATGYWLGLNQALVCLVFMINAAIASRVRIEGHKPWKVVVLSILGTALSMPRLWIETVNEWVGLPVKSGWEAMQTAHPGLVPILLAFALLLFGFRHACKRKSVESTPKTLGSQQSAQ